MRITKYVPDSTKNLYAMRNLLNWLNSFQRTACKILRYYSETQKSKNNHANSGLKWITTPIQVRMLKRLVRRGPFMSLRLISRKWREQGLDVSTSTTRQRVLKHDFQSREPERKPLITLKQKGARLRWDKERLQWGFLGWNNILFNDESMFYILLDHQCIRAGVARKGLLIDSAFERILY